MDRSDSPSQSRLFFVVGLIMVGFGLLLSVPLLTAVANQLGISLQLGGTAGQIRIWMLKVTLILAGLPLLLYNYRTRPGLKILFDVSVGLLFTLLLLFLVEGLFYRLNVVKARNQPATSLTYSEVYVEGDPALGYKLKPNLSVSAVQRVGDALIYDVVYSTNERGRRTTLLPDAPLRDQYLLFFGGSFTFGDGLTDAETLPSQVGELAPNVAPYNFGVPGYGTQQLLINLQQDGITREVTETEGVAIYSFICHHVDRVIGTLYVQNSNGDFMPYYTLDADNNLVRQGTLTSGRPVLATLYAILELSQTAAYYGLIFPRITDRHYALTTRVIAEAEKSYRQKFQSDDFYVLIYPGQRCAEQFIPHLEAAGIKYLDYSTLFTRDEAAFWIPDGHPTAAANRVLAETLVRDLGLGDGP